MKHETVEEFLARGGKIRRFASDVFTIREGGPPMTEKKRLDRQKRRDKATITANRERREAEARDAD